MINLNDIKTLTCDWPLSVKINKYWLSVLIKICILYYLTNMNVYVGKVKHNYEVVETILLV